MHSSVHSSVSSSLHSSVVTGLESLAQWRTAVDHQLHDIARYLAEHELDDEALCSRMGVLRERLASIAWDQAAIAGAIKQTLAAHQLKIFLLIVIIR